MRNNSDFDVVCIGAGPYGISLYAYARNFGLRVGIFGDFLSFWRQNIPSGFVIGTGYDTNISVPYPNWNIQDYIISQGLTLQAFVTRELFLGYCGWLTNFLQPTVDKRLVAEVMPQKNRFDLRLEDGTHIFARAVVVATGPLQHRFVPDYIKALPTNRWSHSADSYVLEKIDQRRVVVVGGGLSAIELAVLLSESGSRVTVVSRRNRTLATVPYYGGLVTSWLERSKRNPAWWVTLSDEERRGIESMIEDYNPMTAWLASRVKNLSILLEAGVSWVNPHTKGISIGLDFGAVIECDYVVAATGFRPSVSNVDFLAKIKNEVGLATTDGSPRLDENCQSSVERLYFAGLLASASLGPVMRLIAGTAIASTSITNSLIKK